MIIKNGTYNGKQLCDMIGLDNNKFKNNVDVYINKLSNYCTIELVGNGRGRKYIITNSDEKEININFSQRSDIGNTRESYTRKSNKYDILYDNEGNKIKDFYVYAHYINEEIVYIGKGINTRAFSPNRSYDIKDITKIKILKFFEKEIDALLFEKNMIKHFKDKGQCKFNDENYHVGTTSDFETLLLFNKIEKSKTEKEKEFNKKINKDIKKMFKYMI